MLQAVFQKLKHDTDYHTHPPIPDHQSLRRKTEQKGEGEEEEEEDEEKNGVEWVEVMMKIMENLYPMILLAVTEKSVQSTAEKCSGFKGEMSTNVQR